MRTVEERAIGAPVLANPVVVDALDAIFEPAPWSPPRSPQVLMTFPADGPWRVPSGWHTDYGSERPTRPVFAVKMFAFLDDVGGEGGGTLVLLGFHRLLERR